MSFYTVDADESPNLAAQLGVMGLPTMVLIKDGEPVSRLTGNQPEDDVRQFVLQ